MLRYTKKNYFDIGGREKRKKEKKEKEPNRHPI